MRLDPLDLVDPARYAQRGYPHDVWTRLRAEAPVAYVEADGYRPFWALTKHADIVQVASQPERFSSAQGITLAREGAPPMPPSEILVLLDPPKHGPVRRLVSRRFTPRAVRGRRDDVERIALDVLGGLGGGPDFVEHVAAPFPLGVIAWILGAPSSDWQLLFRWTNEIIGKDDPEYRRQGESPGQTIKRARGELHGYLSELIAERRRAPRDDLISELLAGSVNGEPLSPDQLLAYCELFVEAGNETTRNAISGAVLAFCEHPDEWEKLRARPELVPDAVEEILRWVSPISHFTRVATEDCVLRDQPVRAGDQLALYFASANRDEDVFDDPFAFRVDRRPNPHLAFGFGEHFCVGAHLARVEIETMLAHLLRRLDGFELSGPIERLGSAVNGSIKRLPLRYVSAADVSGSSGERSERAT
jgi:cholest-4-en-3-one 26-monooxygenase